MPDKNKPGIDMGDHIRVKACSLCVEYIPSDGTRGRPTGTRTSGGALAIFGDREIYSTDIAVIQYIRKNGRIVDCCSKPVAVYGYDKPVVYYLFEPEEIESINKKIDEQQKASTG